MVDPGIVATVASVIAGFGSAMLVFRIQRELQMASKNERNWIPWADRLLIAAILGCLIFVLFPLVSGIPSEPIRMRVASAACASAVVLLTGYVPAILAHYRLFLGGSRCGPRDNPEPAERWLTLLFVALAAATFVGVLARA